MSSIVFHTRNSTYEVDRENKRARRITGKNDPVGAFSAARDGVWVPMYDHSDPEVGSVVLINHDNGRWTRTSYVVSIEEEADAVSVPRGESVQG